jgi:hypothetical protein
MLGGGKRGRSFILIGLLIAAFWFAAGLWGYYGAALWRNIQDKTPYPFYDTDEHLIAHAGGKIGGYVYTDSREAVERSIRDGAKFVEIDWIKTSDGVYIAGHDWEMVNKMTGHSGDKPLSWKEFKNSKIYGKYTPMDEYDVAELMHKYPDWIMLIDKARDIKHLAKAFPMKNRVILQVYGLIGYAKALKAGFDYPTLRLKGGRRGVKGIYMVLMKLMNVKSVILGEKSFNKNIDYIEKLHDEGLTVILYGNPSFQIVESADEIKKYVHTHIDLVDTDAVTDLDE